MAATEDGGTPRRETEERTDDDAHFWESREDPITGRIDVYHGADHQRFQDHAAEPHGHTVLDREGTVVYHRTVQGEEIDTNRRIPRSRSEHGDRAARPDRTGR